MPFYKIYQPPLSLQSLVYQLEVYHIKWNEEPGLPSPFITCLANTEQNLYFYINDVVNVVPAAQVEIPCPAVVITGPKFKPVGLLFGKDHLMIKVTFHPTGTYRLLGINMQQTVNAGQDASSLWGDDVNGLLQKLRTTTEYDAMATIIFSFLVQKMLDDCRPEEPIDSICVEMSDPLNNHSLKTWASKACLGLRQFERLFILRVGISPKLFIRIVRFEYAMKVKNNCPEKNWSVIALECGYTDSSHLLKEFKAFAEFPPGQFYLNQTSGHSELSTG